MLITYLTNQLLGDVLHRDDPCCRAVLVDHHGKVTAVAAHLVQDRLYVGRLRHEQGCPYQIGCQGAISRVALETHQVLHVDEPDHVV